MHIGNTSTWNVNGPKIINLFLLGELCFIDFYDSLVGGFLPMKRQYKIRASIMNVHISKSITVAYDTFPWELTYTLFVRPSVYFDV
jgi:hypothetical protein